MTLLTSVLVGSFLIMAGCSNETHDDHENMNHHGQEETLEHTEANEEMSHDDMDHNDMNQNDEQNHSGAAADKEQYANEPTAFNEGAERQLIVSNTKNITRLDEENPLTMSVKVSQMIWPSTHEENQPNTVILAPLNEWQYSLAALTLVHHPNDGPILYYDDEINEDVLNEINRMQPKGNNEGIEVLVVGNIEESELDKLTEFEIKTIQAANPAAFAQKVEEEFTKTIDHVEEAVIIGSMEESAKEYTITAANWISHMNESLLYVSSDGIPEETKEALALREGSAKIYVLGSENVIKNEVIDELNEYGVVERIEGDSAVSQSIAMAAYKDESTGFGWGITEPGHGFVFASTKSPELAITAAPFAHLGKHAPLIWLDEGQITDDLYQYLAKVKPVFHTDPTEGPYNHGYVLGEFDTISFQTQGILDEKLEIVSADGDGHGNH